VAPAPELVLHENETQLVPNEIASTLSAEEWARFGISVTRRLDDSEDVWRISPGGLVGLAEYANIRLQIDPKLDADIFFLADWAFGRTRDVVRDLNLTARVDALRRDPTATILSWYLDSLEHFVVRWLRRSSELREDVLTGRVRGRVLTTEYARRHVAVGEPHRIPCEYLEHSSDTLQNRILRRTLFHVGSLVPLLPVAAARRHLRASIARIEPYLATVSNVPIAPGDFMRLRLGRAQRHYEPMIQKSQAVLSGLLFTNDIGRHAQRAFLWDASLLYQEALRGILATWSWGSLDPKRGQAVLRGVDGRRVRSSKVDPDYVLRGPNLALVLDAKWKDVLVASRAMADDEDSVHVAVAYRTRVKIARSDIYQAISYSQHNRFAPCHVGLVYPVALRHDEMLPRPMRVEGFVQPVWLLFMDVGVHCRTNLQLFFGDLDQLVA
jgi:5-methylcytosine-specific restriction enzyme subunit McrC